MTRRRHKVPVMRRQDAMALATIVATQGWKRHAARAGVGVEYWEKQLPGGDLNLIESSSLMGGYDIQYVSSGGVVQRLGRKRASLQSAQVAAVLAAMNKGITVVSDEAAMRANPQNWISTAVRNPGRMQALGQRLQLADRPFLSRPLGEQKAILAVCVAEHGYRSCRASVALLGNLPSVRRAPKGRKSVESMTRFVKTLRPQASARRNPPRGAWVAIPVIFAHIPIGPTQLTSLQAEQIAEESP